MSALSSWNLLPTSDPTVSQINESEHIINSNADLLQSLSEESVDESKPYYRDGEWLLALGGQEAKRTVVGRLDVASRRRERYTLTFIIDSGKTKKFYLCEFCQAAGETVWIYYRNYAAQHIPRHHAIHCKPCSSCQKLVFRPLLPSHSRFCSGGSTNKRRRRANPEFIAIEPAEALSSSQISEQADKVEALLISRGLTVVRGVSSHCVGYPVADEDLAKEETQAPASPPTRDTTGEHNFLDELDTDDVFPLMQTSADWLLSDGAAFDDAFGESGKWLLAQDETLNAWWPAPAE